MTNDLPLDPQVQKTADFTDFSWVMDLSPLALIFVVVLLACYFFRRLKNLPTSWVWPITIIGILFYTLIGPDVPHADTAKNLAYKFLYGCIPSIFGTMAAWGLHDKAFAALAAKWPMWGWLVSDEVKNDDPKPRQ
jgi:hypothetical protein